MDMVPRTIYALYVHIEGPYLVGTRPVPDEDPEYAHPGGDYPTYGPVLTVHAPACVRNNI